MSETLRDLVVSLSLQSDNFTRNIKSVNKQIQEAESRFKLAAAGVEGFEKTTTGLTTQLSTLERRLSLQKDAVNQYQRALEAANNKLSECYNRQKRLCPASGGRQKGAAGAQRTGRRGGEAGQDVLEYSGRIGFRDHRGQSQSGCTQGGVPRLSAGGQKAIWPEHGAEEIYAERSGRRQSGQHPIQQRPRRCQDNGGGDRQVQSDSAPVPEQLGCCWKIH